MFKKDAQGLEYVGDRKSETLRASTHQAQDFGFAVMCSVKPCKMSSRAMMQTEFLFSNDHSGRWVGN